MARRFGRRARRRSPRQQFPQSLNTAPHSITYSRQAWTCNRPLLAPQIPARSLKLHLDAQQAINSLYLHHTNNSKHLSDL